MVKSIRSLVNSLQTALSMPNRKNNYDLARDLRNLRNLRDRRQRALNLQHDRDMRRADAILTARAEVRHYADRVAATITLNPAIYQVMSAKLDRAITHCRQLETTLAN